MLKNSLPKNSLPSMLLATWNGIPPQFAQIPNLNEVKRSLEDRYGLTTLHLPHASFVGFGSGCRTE